MKKILLSFFVVLAFAIYIVYQRLGGSSNRIIIPNNLVLPSSTNINTQNTQTQTTQPAPKPVSTSVPVVKPPAHGLYRDGKYTGIVADAYYGNVQVAAVIQGGKITDVQFLDYPQDRSTSREINGQAMPYLITEAIQAQNANVDVISGATATSGAFRESLASALAKAKY